LKKKKELCEQIISLPNHLLEHVIKIIHESEPENIETGESEYSFDINLLKEDTLCKLQNYIITSDNTKAVGGGCGLDKKEKDLPLTLDKLRGEEMVPYLIKKESMNHDDLSDDQSDDNFIVENDMNNDDFISFENENESDNDMTCNFVLYDLRQKEGEKKRSRKCPKCKKQFKDKSNLVKHIRTHTGEKPYLCQYCGKTFRHTSTRNDHLNIHLNRNPHVCDYEGCNKQFANAANLKRHKRIHTGEKPYKCRHCEKRFTQSTNCKQHERTHLKDK